MPSNFTQNYNLNQWEAGDRVLRTDFNADNAKIDAAIKAVDIKASSKAEASVVTALQTAVAGKGNCQIVTGSYVGDDTQSRTLTFPAGFQPKLVIVGNTYVLAIVKGAGSTRLLGYDNDIALSVSWSDNSVTWSSSRSLRTDLLMNTPGITYHYVMLG